MPRSRLLLAALAFLVSLLWAAPDALAGDATTAAAAAFRSGERVYAQPGSEGVVGSATLDAVRSDAQGASPAVYVVVLADSDGFSGPRPTLLDLAQRTGARGTYLVQTSKSIYGYTTVLPTGVLGSTLAPYASTAADATARGRQLTEAVAAVVAAGDEAGAGVGGNGGSGGSGGSGGVVGSGSQGSGSSTGSGVVGAVVLGGLGLGGFALWRSTRRRRAANAQSFAEVRTAAEEDVTLLGEDIDRLDLDVAAPGVDDAERTDYTRALDSYDRAKSALAAAGTPQELEPVSTALEDGRYAMECVRARLAGRPLPDRRPPCFFNPQHGPSSRDVSWAPDGGAPRLVPACEADAERVERGEVPQSREVLVAGQRRPYWDAGPMYGPWAGGYYSGYGGGMAMGGLLPGILVGTMLGGSMGGWGGGGGTYIDNSTTYVDNGNGGGFGGGGDFGGGGGGGDFGGGGGGGDFGGGGDSGGGSW